MTSSIQTRDELIHVVTDKYTNIDRSYDNLLDNELKVLKRKYEEQVEQVNKHFAAYKLKLHTIFNLSLKKINALYDSYEITLGQINSYVDASSSGIVDLLKENINNIEKNIIETSFYTQDGSFVCDINPTINTKNIKLAFDPSKLKYPLFTKSELTQAKGSIIHRLLFRNNIYYINIKSINHNNCVYLNYTSCKYIKCCIIDELDIIILWDSNMRQLSSSHIFVKMSTGELIYNSNTNNIGYKTEFIYCNSIIIRIMSWSRSVHIIPYYINNYDVTVGQKQQFTFNIDKYIECNSQLCNETKFYGDNRGLYLYINEEIYFVDRLQVLLNINIDRRTGDYYILNLTKKIKLDITGYELLHILNIDYDKYLIYIIKKPLPDPTSTSIFTFNSELEQKNVASVVYPSISDRQLLI